MFPRRVPANTKRNVLRVPPAILLQRAVVPVVRLLHAARTRRMRVGYTDPAYCCFVPVVPASLNCPAAIDAHSKLLPLAGCATNLCTAVYEFITNSRYL